MNGSSLFEEEETSISDEESVMENVKSADASGGGGGGGDTGTVLNDFDLPEVQENDIIIESDSNSTDDEELHSDCFSENVSLQNPSNILLFLHFYFPCTTSSRQCVRHLDLEQIQSMK